MLGKPALAALVAVAVARRSGTGHLVQSFKTQSYGATGQVKGQSNSTAERDMTRTASEWEVEWLARKGPSSMTGQPAQRFEMSTGELISTGAPAWAQSQAFQEAFKDLLRTLNEICAWSLFPSHGSQNKKGKAAVKEFNHLYLDHNVDPPHMLVFFSIPRDSRETSNKAAWVTRSDYRHGLRMAPTRKFTQEPFIAFLDRSPNYRRWCCCGDFNVDLPGGSSVQSCKWKYTSKSTRCNTGMFQTKMPIESADGNCARWVKNPDPNDAPPPPMSASDDVPRQCRAGEFRGSAPFCMGEDVQRDCDVQCQGCQVVIPCSR